MHDADSTVRLSALNVYPVKSCAGVPLREALLIETGIDFDRAWMIVDEHNKFITQRDEPRLALVRPTLRSIDCVLRAPGMLAMHLELFTVGAPTQVTIWKDQVAAYDMGDLCAQWFSDFLGRKTRLVRFDPEQRRLSNPQWTGAIEAENAFTDGYPLLVVSAASLDEVNRRLKDAGHAPVTMERFRPNLVLEGLDAHGEDFIDELAFESHEGPVRLKFVKPCARCSIPDIDPQTAAVGHAVNDVLAGYRADARVNGATTFGMNAVIVEGFERVLNVGVEGTIKLRFD